MTKLEKTSALIAEMTTEEKAQLLAELLQYFYFPATGISHTPGVCGGRACIRDTRIPVWSIVEAKHIGATDIELLQSFQGLTAEDITNAMRYYQEHKEEIEADIAGQATIRVDALGPSWVKNGSFLPTLCLFSVT